MSIVLTKAQLISALNLASVAMPRKANVATLTELYNALPPHQQYCPECGIHLSNGLLHVDDTGANEHSDKSYRDLRDPAFAAGEYNCMGCGAHFGEPVVYDAPVTSTGLKIEKDRPEQNGVKRPSIGGKCRAIWDALDQLALDTGDDPTAKQVKELAALHGWNPNNASIEYYQWRKFNGITKPAKVPAAPAPVAA